MTTGLMSDLDSGQLIFIKSTKITRPLAQCEIDRVCECSVEKEDINFQMRLITQFSLTFSVKISYSLTVSSFNTKYYFEPSGKTEVHTMKPFNSVALNVFCHVQERFLVVLKALSFWYYNTASTLKNVFHAASPLISSSLCQAVFAWRHLSSRLVAESSVDLTINPHLQSH